MGVGEMNGGMNEGRGVTSSLGFTGPATVAEASDPKGQPSGMLAAPGLGTMVWVCDIKKGYCHRRR